MAHVHITLVGGQPEPIYYGIQYANPDKILFVHSSDEKSKEYTERLSKMFPSIDNEKQKFDPVNIQDIMSKVNHYAEVYKNDEVTINISGGTKPWAYYFSTIFGPTPNCKIFYVDQKNKVWNLTDGTTDVVAYDMDIAIGLYGNSIAHKTNYNNINKSDLASIETIETIRSNNKNMFYALISSAKNNTNSTKWFCGKSSLMWDTKDKSFTFSVMTSKGLYTQNVKSTHIRHLLFHAKWFEYEIASYLSRWQNAVDIYNGCEFKFANKTAKNEIDIIVNIGNRLIFIECKTQIEQYTDIDKFRSAMRNYSGTSTIGLFVTREEMDDRAKEKCKDNGIMTFSVAECEAANKNVAKTLMNLLDEKINKINAR